MNYIKETIALKEILSGVSPDTLYWDVYQDFRNQAWNNNNFDSDYCLLDKWVWKYREYTVEMIRQLPTVIKR